MLSFVGEKYTALSKMLILIGFSGLVGQITNKLAIRMILDYLDINLGITRIRVPGSGLLQRNLSKLIDFVSEGSVQVLNKEVVRKELREQEVMKNLLEAVQKKPGKVVDGIISVVLTELESILSKDKFYILLRDGIIKGYARKHRALAIANVTGIIDYDDLTYTIIETLKDTARQLQLSTRAKAHLETFVREVCKDLTLHKEKLEEKLSTMVAVALDQFSLITAVRNRLNQFSPGEIKEKVEEVAADYLGWIEIWGGVLGAMVGLLMGTIL
ncbi:MAG: DUF445 family protein [Deltaproteobacteria bacterium]|nr:DUF445 family protein [Deltaproteobacteria bacterium]